jgi:two-component system sensor histidine kinase KdpD
VTGATGSQSENRSGNRGRLKIYLGYAAGVGKTYQMLEEARQLKERGVDIVIGYFEPHGREDTIRMTEGLEIIPRRVIEYRGTRFEEMDTEAILQRHPQVCLVDEFPHTNVPGAERAKRWEDVLALRDAGIDVFTTMNVQHIESLNDQILEITGVRVRETIPDWLLKEADEIVMVDVTPRALLNRLARGAVYAPDKAKLAVENFFKEPTLVALRELALRETAHELDIRQTTHELLRPNAPAGTSTSSRNGRVSNERILIYVTEELTSAALIRRGRRVADFLQAECMAVAVILQADISKLPAAQREALERHLALARNLHIETRVVHGEDSAKGLVEFARLHQITHIFMARPEDRPRLRLGRNVIQDVVRRAGDMQVTVVAQRAR